MRAMSAAVITLSVLVSGGCATTAVQEPEIEARVLSEPGAAEVTYRGKIVGSTPTDLVVQTMEDLVEIDALLDGREAHEIRMRFDQADVVTVTFRFGDQPSPVARALGLSKVLIFDYSDRTTFDVDESVVKTGFLAQLVKQAEILNGVFRDVDVYVCGHTDATGGDAHNQLLSLERARAVSEVLKANGVAAERLHEQGFGEDYPIADNDAEVGRSQNRRTEIVLPRGQ